MASEIHVLDLQTREHHIIINNGSAARYIPTGHVVYGTGDTLYAVGFDVDSLKVTTEQVPVVFDVVTKPSGAVDFAVANDGTLVYVFGSGAQTDRSLVLVDRDGGETLLPGEPGQFSQAILSPDGLQVAMMVGDPRGATEIGIRDRSRGGVPLLTTDGGSFPIWSQDGERIVFASQRDGTWGLFSRDRDGSGSADRLDIPDDATYLRPLGWSEDGSLVFLYGDTSGQRVGLLSIEGNLTWPPFSGDWSGPISPTVSPGGQWIAYESRETGQLEVSIERLPGAGDRQQVSGNGGRHPVWVGDELFYIGEAGGTRVGLPTRSLMAAPVGNTTGQRVALDAPEVVFEDPSPFVHDLWRSYDVTADGQQFLFSKIAEDAIREVVLVQNWFEELQRLVPTP